jgi:hypothetical protein
MSASKFIPLVQCLPISKEQLLVAVAHSDFGGGHIGIGYAAKDGPKMLHLAWHQKLRDEIIPEGLRPECWVAAAMQLPKKASKQIIAGVRAVANRMPKINYGIDFIAARGSFTGNSYQPAKGSTGLTCASFVVEVLAQIALPLVAVDTWKPSPENDEWAKSVCDALTNAGVDPSHVDAVRASANSLRLRPFEVAAAAVESCEHWPCTYEGLQPQTQSIMDDLNQGCPLPALVNAAHPVGMAAQ